MDESATLKVGQCGTWIQSTTEPLRKPGGRKIRSRRFPVIPPRTSPATTAQALDSTLRTSRRVVAAIRRENIEKKRVALGAKLNAAPEL